MMPVKPLTPLTALLLTVMAGLCFIYYVLGLMHLQPLFLSGGLFFLILFLLIRILTLRPKK